jgi:hypothetical protein
MLTNTWWNSFEIDIIPSENILIFPKQSSMFFASNSSNVAFSFIV